ncbi:unnamed protein product [Linum tenue]|uniref:E2F-associated phosphoprotein n=1 Tax=Linum tenue TaxID=586396 RepID=A0AAV0K1P7_9ROSI|nr:unnamed protein product [Linum tenue]
MEQSPPPTSQQTQSYAAASSSSDEEIDYSVKPEFYDPKLDERDEAWVGKQRRGNRRSDAVLSCPACFTTVSLQSQRHERYVTQYRAVAVMNCNVESRGDQMAVDGTEEGGGRGKPASRVGSGRRSSEGSNSSSVDRVGCSVCDTQVGVRDEEEVYHFFNVIPSET